MEFLDPAKLHHWKLETKVPQKYIMGPLKLPAGKEVQEWCVLGLQKEATFDVSEEESWSKLRHPHRPPSHQALWFNNITLL